MARVPRTLALLLDLDLDALKVLWSKTFRSSPPTQAKRELLLRLLVYGVNEKAQGGLSRATRKSLDALSGVGSRREDEEVPTSGAISLRLGARLVRSWKGATHEVTVLDRGFDYRGHKYRSLSEIAEVITGAHWSGPRFFGLKKLRTNATERASA